MAVSDTPWSKFSAADYSVEQWHRACIAHEHEGPATIKDQCKLPVREPDGTLNRAGVHAAAAALAGARGGVKLSVSEKIAATKTMPVYYRQLGEKPPEPKKPAFLMKHEDNLVDNFLAHHGIKGMRWGIRRKRGSDGTVEGGVEESQGSSGGSGSSGASSSGKERLSADAERFLKTRAKQQSEMSDREIKEANQRAKVIKEYNDLFGPKPNQELQLKVERLRLEKEYGKLKAELHPSALQRVSRLVKASAPMFNTVYNMSTSKAGKKITRQLTDTLADAFKGSTGTNTSRTTRTKRPKQPKGAPTSGATRVTAEHVSTQSTPVYNVTTLNSAASPSALPQRRI